MTITVSDQRFRPRKQPRQPRGHETQARILDAARRVFATHGYAAGTTNRIAAEAGLSIGSLYQYFPNKDAILVQLVDAHIDAGSARLDRALADVFAAHGPGLPPLAVLVGAVVDAMVEVHATDRRLHRVLFEEAPRPAELLARLRSVEAAAVERVASPALGPSRGARTRRGAGCEDGGRHGGVAGPPHRARRRRRHRRPALSRRTGAPGGRLPGRIVGPQGPANEGLTPGQAVLRCL